MQSFSGSTTPHWSDQPRRNSEVIALPVIWVAVLLSLLIHALLLWGWHWEPPVQDKPHGDTALRLRLKLPPESRASRPPPPAAAAPRARQQARVPRVAPLPAVPPAPSVPSRPSESPVMSATAPTPSFPLAPPSPPAVALQTPRRPAPPPSESSPPMQGDLSSFIEARRRERAVAQGANPEPAEDERSRQNRIVAANIAAPNSQVFGYDPAKGGGVFQIETLAYDYADFIFFGWDKDIRRRVPQHVEVRKGSASDIRVAVVRKMITIIREHEQGDFTWYSERLGRNLTLSARPADNAGLETVLLREFFDR